MQIHRYDSTPDVQEVGPGIYSIPIPQPFYADNNVYVIDSGEPTLIDSGYIQSLGLLQRGLRDVGLSLKKIKHIIYTHEHIDHISAALTLRGYTDAKMYGMAGMADYVGNFVQFVHRFQRAMNRLIYKAHHEKSERDFELTRAHEGWQKFLASVDQGDRVDLDLRMDVELVEGDVIRAGEREIGFIHTPGHNRWHLTPYILGEGVYFTGDLVLENVSAIYAELDGNLADYYASLDRLMELPIARLMPAHGAEPKSPKKAIRLIRKTLALLERGIMRRLKEGEYDLSTMVREAIGPRAKSGGHYITALATIHAILQSLIERGLVGVREVDPPYEMYYWNGDGGDRGPSRDSDRAA
jgi:glyoxylase-like metal-dependent hydrolase (beta-lactamase superfamily II)